MEYKTLELTDLENQIEYEIYPTSISQVIGKLGKVREFIEQGEIEVALNFLKNAEKAADNIIEQRIIDDDPDNWSGIRLEKIDYDSFWVHK